MTSVRPLFAQQSIPIEITSAPWHKMDAATKEILITLGAVALVTLLALMWALAFRKRRRRHNRHHSHRHNHAQQRTTTPPPVAEDEEENLAEAGTDRHRRRHRRRRDHRPRNPTLAETGGLPPLRTGPPPEP
jgi:ABC-type nickel/cobalt efflux system permease component RcnA